MKWLQSSKISLVLIGVLSFAVVTLATEDTWTYKADIPTTRTWVGGCVLDGKIYVIGGGRSDSSATSVVEMYDPLLDTWTKKASMPSARCYHATCTFDGKIYVFGGGPGVWSPAVRSVFLYDPQTGTWTQKADMPYAIGASGIAVVENTIYLIGGAIDTSSPPVSTVMAYDPIAESWIQKADMPTARLCLSACVVDGKIYAIGGCKEDWQTFAYKLVEVYDPSTNTWTRKADMPTERWSPSACVVDGEIHVIGGNANNLQPTPAHEVYDPSTNTWTTKAPMQQKRLGHFVELVGNKIYAMGGHYPNLIMVSKTEEYDTGLTAVPSPDFNGDWIVDFKDFSKLAQYWGQDESSVDIAPSPFGDNIVNYKDLAVFAENWLKEIPELGLFAHWKLDETEGSIAHDSISNKNGNLNGNPIWQPTGGVVLGALELDGVDDYVSTPFVLNPNIGAFSVFAWIKGGAPGQVIISQSTVSGAVWLCTDSSYGKLSTKLTDGNRFTRPLVSEFVITDGDWHRIGVVWDGSRRHLYGDGEELAWDTGGLANLVSSDGGLCLGAGKTLDAAEFWSGLIDDVRIYDRAVTP